MTVLIMILCRLLCNREEAAEMLGIGLRKLDQLVARGHLKSRRIDDCVRFYVGDLIQFASENKAEVKSGENTAEVKNDPAA
jgi:phage terminase Nu1 subunit (DNA packaging protein)